MSKAIRTYAGPLVVLEDLLELGAEWSAIERRDYEAVESFVQAEIANGPIMPAFGNGGLSQAAGSWRMDAEWG